MVFKTNVTDKQKGTDICWPLYMTEKLLMYAALTVLSPPIVSDTHMLFLSAQSILLN